MDMRCWFVLFWVGTNACLAPDIDASGPFVIDTEVGGCLDFATLEAALTAVSNWPAASISLMLDAEMPTWTVSNMISLRGSSKCLAITGTVSIVGLLSISNVTLISSFSQDFPLNVFGTLTLTSCLVTNFPSPILVRGQVLATNSTFKDNAKGVFSASALGGRLTLQQSQFLNNAKTGGAVFSIFPTSGSGSTQYSLTDCLFQGNGAETGSSVLLLNDFGVASSATQIVSFSRCNFTGNSRITISISSKLFNVNVSECQFDRETQLISGTLLGTNVTLSRIAVTRSQGPLFVLSFSGVFSLTDCNFTEISTGPLVTALGQGISVSLVYFSQVQVSNITNWSQVTFGNLLNAIKATVWLQNTTITKFGGDKMGVFYIIACLFFTRGLAASIATTNVDGVGAISFSTIEMNDTLINAVNSGGSMLVLYQSSGSITGIKYEAITGLFQPIPEVYSTNMFNINTMSDIRIEGLDIKLEREGTPLIFVGNANVTVVNVTLTGPLGGAFISVQNSKAVLRHLSLNITKARMFAYGLLNAQLDFDHLSLHNISILRTLFSLSSGSSVRIQQLSLFNVTTQGLCKGPLYSMHINTASIEKSSIDALVYFSISVNVSIGNLIMKHSVGSLFCAFSSNLVVAGATIVNFTVPRIFLYLVSSSVTLSSAVLDGITLAKTGGLATVLSQSALHLTAVSMFNIVGVEHGIFSLVKSTLTVADSSIARLNVSLAVAQQTNISISETEVLDMLLDQNAATQLMTLNGGLLSCFNCPSVIFTGVKCRNISASGGGVVYAEASEERQNSVVLLERSEFEHCRGRIRGGVVSTEKCALRIVRCDFRSNTASYGGVVSSIGGAESLFISNSSFLHNSALIAGSCVWWTGELPTLTFNNYTDNSAVYGNPLASNPHHFLLLSPGSLLPAKLPIQGVTGQPMDQPLLVGVFDILEQLIVTDNSTVVSLYIPNAIKGAGSSHMIATMGIASFIYLFYPFSTSTMDFTFSAPSIANLTFPYRFRDCQPGEIRSLSGCFPCPKNSYSLQTDDFLCGSCPHHVQCHGRAQLVLDQNFWRSGNLTDVIYPCLVLESCLGGADSLCASGYEGALCSSCAQGYFRVAGWMCKHCDGEVPVPVRGVIVALFLISTTVLLPQLYLTTEGLGFRAALAFRIFLQHTQVIMFATLLHAQWGLRTLVHHEVMRVLASLGGLWLFAGCQYQEMGIEQHYFQVIAGSFYPVLFFLACILIWTLAKCSRLAKANMLLSMLASALICVYHYFPTLCLLAVSLWQCQTVEGESLLVADMTQKCWTGVHLRYALTVSIPLAVFLTLSHGVAFVCILKPTPSRLLSLCRTYLTAGYKDNRKSWEIRMCIYRTAMALLSLSYPGLDSFSAAILFSCAIGFSIQSYVKWTPYKRPVHNTMAVAGQLVALVIIFSGIQGGDSLVLSLACISSCSIFAFGVLALRQLNVYLISPISQEQYSTSQMKREEVLFPMASMEESQGNLKPPPSSFESHHLE